jgi:hypothetical protein
VARAAPGGRRLERERHVTFHLDPDLRLYTRLTLGRGWRLATTVALWTIGVAALVGGVISPFGNRRVPGDPGFLPIALLILMVAASRAAVRLLDLERGGLLDQTRMCARPPFRVLLAFVTGSTWPSLILAGVLLASRQHIQPADVALAGLVFLLALDIALLVYGMLPPDIAPDSRFAAPLLFIVAIGGLAALNALGWITDDALAAVEFSRAEHATALVAVAAVPVAVWLACRRIKRPARAASRSGATTYVEVLARAIPRLGPPEFQKQLRRGLLSGGVMVTVIVAPLAVLAGVYASHSPSLVVLRPVALNAVPYAVMLIGAFAVSMTVRAELESATVDLVRLTPQSPEIVALSWYAAIALPFWIGAALAAGALWVSAPDVFVFSRALIVFAVAWPACSLAEGFQQRKPGTYLWLPYFAAGGILAFILAMSIALATPGGRLPTLFTPGSVAFAVSLMAVVLIGASAGRLRRRDGPPLAGLAAAAGVVAIAFALREPVLPRFVYARIAPGVLAVLASFFAEERDVPSAPWMRLGVVAGAAMAATSIVAAMEGATIAGSMATGVCAALGMGIGLLSHERLWKIPVLSFALRAGVLLALERAPLVVYQIMYAPGRSRQMLPQLSDLRPALDATDVAVLVVVFALAALAHAHVRKARVRVA